MKCKVHRHIEVGICFYKKKKTVNTFEKALFSFSLWFEETEQQSVKLQEKEHSNLHFDLGPLLLTQLQ